MLWMATGHSGSVRQSPLDKLTACPFSLIPISCLPPSSPNEPRQSSSTDHRLWQATANQQTHTKMINLWKWLFLAFFVPCFLTYALQHLVVAYFYKTQNLKKRYNATWALVTGASSGERARGGGYGDGAERREDGGRSKAVGRWGPDDSTRARAQERHDERQWEAIHRASLHVHCGRWMAGVMGTRAPGWRRRRRARRAVPQSWPPGTRCTSFRPHGALLLIHGVARPLVWQRVEVESAGTPMIAPGVAARPPHVCSEPFRAAPRPWLCHRAGIGKSIAFKLARQGLNVVLVALGDPLLDATYDEISTAFPACQFRKVQGRGGGGGGACVGALARVCECACVCERVGMGMRALRGGAGGQRGASGRLGWSCEQGKGLAGAGGLGLGGRGW